MNPERRAEHGPETFVNQHEHDLFHKIMEALDALSGDYDFDLPVAEDDE